jgi:hypothetical protein
MRRVWVYPKRYESEWDMRTECTYRTLLVYRDPFGVYFAFCPWLRLRLGRAFGWKVLRFGRVENWKWKKSDFANALR